MMLRPLLALLLLAAARAGGEEESAAEGRQQPAGSMFLFCNATSACLVRGLGVRPSLARRRSPPPPLAAAVAVVRPTSPPLCQPLPPLSLRQPCGALDLNEHCRMEGGYQLETCVVGTAGGPHSHGVDSQRPLRGKIALAEGTVMKQHSGCKPTSRGTVPQLMLGCAGGAAAALLLLRWRQRQRSV